MTKRNMDMSLEEIIHVMAHYLLWDDNTSYAGKDIFEIVSWIGDKKISEALLRLLLKKNLEEWDDELIGFRDDDFEFYWPGSNQPSVRVMDITYAIHYDIEKHKIDLPINVTLPKHSIYWLNELLKIPCFYDKFLIVNKKIASDENIQYFVSITEDYRFNDFNNLNYNQRKNIRKLNRLILETNYKSTPKRRGKDISEAIKNSYLVEDFLIYDRPTPFSDPESWIFCWDLAESLVSFLEDYTKYNGKPDFAVWSDIIQHESFADFVNSLYLVTQGKDIYHFSPNGTLEFIKMKWNDPYESLSRFVFATDYINRCMEWIATKFPNHSSWREDADLYLFNLCADLIKYTDIETANADSDRIGVEPSFPEEILLWNPAIALNSLCASYNRGVLNTCCFHLESFDNAVEAVSEKLPGTLGDQLIGIFYTNIDTDIREGALKLINEQETIKSSELIKLADSISCIKDREERRRYSLLLPSIEEFSKNYKNENDISMYREQLEKCLSDAE